MRVKPKILKQTLTDALSNQINFNNSLYAFDYVTRHSIDIRLRRKLESHLEGYLGAKLAWILLWVDVANAFEE